MNVYDFTVKDIQGHDVSLSQYKDKVLLIVNTASNAALHRSTTAWKPYIRNIRIKAWSSSVSRATSSWNRTRKITSTSNSSAASTMASPSRSLRKSTFAVIRQLRFINTSRKPRLLKATKPIKKAASSSRRSFPNTIRTMPRATASNGISPNSSSTGTAARSSALNPARHRKN